MRPLVKSGQPAFAALTKLRPTTGDHAAAWIKQKFEEYYKRPELTYTYRNKAAWSLRQLDDKFTFLDRNMTIIDLGCFPGGWSQVAVERTQVTSSSSRVIGVDKVAMDFLEDHIFVQGDVAKESTLAKLHSELRGLKADVVLSDLALPNLGLKIEDHLASAQCCLYAAKVMERTLRLGGWFVVKMYYGSESARYRMYLDTRFETVRTFRPPSSRHVMRENFYVCRGFLGRPAISEEVQTKGTFSDRLEGFDKWSAEYKEHVRDNFADSSGFSEESTAATHDDEGSAWRGGS